MGLPIFPILKGVTFPAQRRPVWKTLHQEAVSGQDNPVALWSYPRWSYALAYDFLRSDSVNLEWQALAAFFNQVQGSAQVFQFADPDDGVVSNQTFAVGNGSQTAFPLVRTLTGFGGVAFVEPVFAPVTGSGFTVMQNSTPVTAFSTGATGLVTFASPPAAGVVCSWSGSFNWLCRFDDDAADFEKFMTAFWRLKQIRFTTIKTQSR